MSHFSLFPYTDSQSEGELAFRQGRRMLLFVVRRLFSPFVKTRFDASRDASIMTISL